MWGYKLFWVSLIALALFASFKAANGAELPKPYKDGCSGGMSAFHRSVLKQIPPWESCCDEHDRAYARSHTWTARAHADHQLFYCVANKGYPIMAGVIWTAVRLGGQTALPEHWSQRDHATTQWSERSRPE